MCKKYLHINYHRHVYMRKKEYDVIIQCVYIYIYIYIYICLYGVVCVNYNKS